MPYLKNHGCMEKNYAAIKTITANTSTIEGIRKAERQKTRLENAGYVHIKTQQIGLERFISYFRKPNNKGDEQ